MTATALLIEDNQDDARIFREILDSEAKSSFVLEHANTLEAGLARLAQGAVSVVLLDLGLPDSRGLETLEKTHAAAPLMPIVVLTSPDDEALVLGSVKRGAQDFLVKGQIDGNLLVRTMHNAVERQNLLTAIDEARATAEEANRLKSRFLANISHELRTPLNAIVGFGHVLEKGTYGPLNERQQRYLGDIVQSGQDLLKLVNDLLELRRIDEDQVPLPSLPCALEPALHEAARLTRPVLEGTSKTLRIDVAAGIGRVLAEHRALVQITLQLLSNAVKFSPEGGVICVQARQIGQQVEVAITDDGIGIDASDHERIFQYFERATHKESGKPGGIGLALTRAMLRRHGGRIRVESSRGRGSTFTFSLRAVEP